MCQSCNSGDINCDNINFYSQDIDELNLNNLSISSLLCENILKINLVVVDNNLTSRNEKCIIYTINIP